MASEQEQVIAELLPCPFCSHKAYCNMQVRGISYVSCESKKCGLRTKLFPRRADAVAAWNTRTSRAESALAAMTAERDNSRGTEQVMLVDIVALRTECDRLRAALGDAAMSLESIRGQAGRDEYMKHMDQVRGYAYSRSIVARKALAPQDAAPGAEGEANDGK